MGYISSLIVCFLSLFQSEKEALLGSSLIHCIFVLHWVFHELVGAPSSVNVLIHNVCVSCPLVYICHTISIDSSLRRVLCEYISSVYSDLYLPCHKLIRPGQIVMLELHSIVLPYMQATGLVYMCIEFGHSAGIGNIYVNPIFLPTYHIAVL